MSDNDPGSFTPLMSEILEVGDPLTHDERLRLEALSQAVNICAGTLPLSTERNSQQLMVGVIVWARLFYRYLTEGEI